jgi:hypothetical protein
VALDIGEVWPTLLAFRQPDEVARVRSRDLSKRPSGEDPEVEDGPGRTSWRRPCSARPRRSVRLLATWRRCVSSVICGATERVVEKLERFIDPCHGSDLAAEVGVMASGLREIGAADGPAVGIDIRTELCVWVPRRFFHAPLISRALGPRQPRPRATSAPAVGSLRSTAESRSVSSIASALCAPTITVREARPAGRVRHPGRPLGGHPSRPGPARKHR